MDIALHDLKAQVLLEGLDLRELEIITSLLDLVKVPKDEHVFREKEACRGIWMIKSGRLEISKTTPDGWKQPLVMVGSGSFVGEIATLEKTDHATDARIIENAELLLFPKGAFEELEGAEPKVMLKIIKNIAIVAALNVRRMNDKFIKVLVNY
jgi:CRP/FNR family transcriptional regulator